MSNCQVFFTKSQNHEEYQSANLIHINLLESTVVILDEISDQEQLNENDVKSWKDHVAVFEVLLTVCTLFVLNLAQLSLRIVEVLVDQKLSLKKKPLRN